MLLKRLRVSIREDVQRFIRLTNRHEGAESIQRSSDQSAFRKELFVNLLEAIEQRHSVRKFNTAPIDPGVVSCLEELIEDINRESGLSFQLRFEDEEAFGNVLARYGKFENVTDYLALVGKKDDVHEMLCGYYGERFVLEAQRLGLRTCWVGGTYSKRKTVAKVGIREKLHLVIAFGTADEDGVLHRMKPLEDLYNVPEGVTPDWFIQAMEAVRLAPSAMNQQRYLFTLHGDVVSVKAYKAFYSQIDLGIAKYHFEIGAAAGGATEQDWSWEK